MRPSLFRSCVLIVGLSQTGCGTAVPQLPEVWDRINDSNATEHMEKQIKLAIYCDLREGVVEARKHQTKHFVNGKEVTTDEDQILPESWGAQVTLTFTVDESSKFAPGTSFKTPMHSATTHFVGETIGASPLISSMTYGPVVAQQNYAFGLGGVLSSAANRIDIFNTFYSVKELADFDPSKDVCHHPPPEGVMGPPSWSSPFLVRSNLDLVDWLPQAASAGSFLHSSRAGPNGTGDRLGGGGSFAPDTISHHIKFTVLSSMNATPTWNLVRVSGNPSAPFFDTGRTRTHELLITIGPGKAEAGKGKKITALSDSAAAVHNSQLYGSAVNNNRTFP